MIFKIINTNQPEGRLEDARVHCVVLKVRAVPSPPPANTGTRKGPEVRLHQPQGPAHPVPQDPTACMCELRQPPPFPLPKQRTEQEPSSSAPHQMFHP